MKVEETKSRVAFGLFEADLDSGLLWKAGYRVKLQSQPFKLLTELLKRPGQVVSRDELQARLWGDNTTVDFDHSIGIAINKIREALGDSAESPRFVETLARRGYRFIAPVTYVPEPTVDGFVPDGGLKPAVPVGVMVPEAPETKSTAQVPSDPSVSRVVALELPPSPARSPLVTKRMLPPPWLLAALAGMVMLAVYLVAVRHPATTPPHIARVTQEGHFAPSLNNMESLAAIASDGVHLFAPVLENGRSELVGISLTDGAEVPLNIPREIANPAVADISPDGSKLLLREHRSAEAEQPLWVLPTIGGSARRVGTVLAHDATWMPDGDGILYANGNDLYLTQLPGNSTQLYARLSARAYWLRWEPNGTMLRYTMIDPIAHTSSLWEQLSTDRVPHRMLASFSMPASECCGTWTATGDAYVFQSSQGGSMNLWKLSGTSSEKPIRLTDGPMEYESPVAARSGNRVYFLGVDARSELERVTSNGELRPERGFLSSAARVEYSRDGQWVAWTNDMAVLWRAKADGTDVLQLTPDHLDVFLARWSPDGSRLSLMGREPGKAWRLYLVGADGKNFQPLLTDAHNAADPSWSPDGQSLAFGRVNDVMGKEAGARTLSLLNLRTNQVMPIAGSENLFSPRWSPDGRYIAALTLDQRTVRVLNVASGSWTTLPVRSGADPVWSSDSRFLYVHASLDPGQPIDRVSVSDGRVEEVVRLAESQAGDVVDYVFAGLARDNTPLVRTRVFTGNIYDLDLH